LTLPQVFTPNAHIPRNISLMLVAGWIAFILVFWMTITFGADISGRAAPSVPSPLEAANALGEEWQQGAAYQLMISLSTSLEAIGVATVLGLSLAYLATIPFFRPLAAGIARLRFLSLTGVLMVFMGVFGVGHSLKVAALTFSILTFFLNDMLQIIDDIPQGRFDHARTLGLSKWGVLREVVIRGTLANAFESVRMNAAIAWMMLTMVEGVSRAEGGIGLLLISLQRSGNYTALLAIQLLIFAVGIGQDYLIKSIKALACPYTVRRRS